MDPATIHAVAWMNFNTPVLSGHVQQKKQPIFMENRSVMSRLGRNGRERSHGQSTWDACYSSQTTVFWQYE